MFTSYLMVSPCETTVGFIDGMRAWSPLLEDAGCCGVWLGRCFSPISTSLVGQVGQVVVLYDNPDNPTQLMQNFITFMLWTCSKAAMVPVFVRKQ